MATTGGDAHDMFEIDGSVDLGQHVAVARRNADHYAIDFVIHSRRFAVVGVVF